MVGSLVKSDVDVAVYSDFNCDITCDQGNWCTPSAWRKSLLKHLYGTSLGSENGRVRAQVPTP